jgi:UDP-N-acetylmuramoyl-tripeptide--D-alanyl-D-alanine ligase
MSRLTFEGFIAANPSATFRWGRVLARLDVPFNPSTDSRTLGPGDAFVCLRGPNFDGHDHISQAVSRGASAVIADDARKVTEALSIPAILVSDAKRAYMNGAAAARRLARCTVIGVTGSVGKTTTTSMCAQLLEMRRRVLKTPHNDNNEIGVSRLCYRLGEGVDVAAIEMGARGPGEIAELVAIAAPEIGVLTNIGETHMEFFDDREALARTKFALFGSGAKPVLSAADEWSAKLAVESGLGRSALWIRLCGDPPQDGLLLSAGTPDRGRVPLTFGASHAFVPWHLVGEHHLRDALLAAGAALLAGLSFDDVVAGLGELRLPAGRFELHRLSGGATVIYDAYNASPSSMAHALRAFAEVPAARHIAVLGSMAELGREGAALHEDTGAAAARSGVDSLYCGGAFAESLADGARKAGMPADRVMIFADNGEMAGRLRETMAPGDAILLKGSRVQKMEEILAALTAESAATT